MDSSRDCIMESYSIWLIPVAPAIWAPAKTIFSK